MLQTLDIIPNKPIHWHWLVVSTPLKNVSQLGSLFPIPGKTPNMATRLTASQIITNHQIVFHINHHQPDTYPKMEVSSNRGTPSYHPNFNGIFLYKPSSYGFIPHGNPFNNPFTIINDNIFAVINHDESLLTIWRFPKIGVPPVIILMLLGFSTINQPFWGTPMAMETMETPTLRKTDRNIFVQSRMGMITLHRSRGFDTSSGTSPTSEPVRKLWQTRRQAIITCSYYSYMTAMAPKIEKTVSTELTPAVWYDSS